MTGSAPCEFNKREGTECSTCRRFSPWRDRILIIKLDAMGDVVRTGFLTAHIRQRFEDPFIVWITRSESLTLVGANPDVDQVWDYDITTTNRLLAGESWRAIYNLSNDYPSSALCSLARLDERPGSERIGFFLDSRGLIQPTNVHAARWMEMAVFDRVKRENRLSFQEIMLQIAGFRGDILLPKIQLSELIRQNVPRARDFFPGNGPSHLIGINTGSGSRWPQKMLSTSRLCELTNLLLKEFPSAGVVILGGPQEAERNQRLQAALSDVRVVNPGCTFSPLEFAALIEQCDVLVCGDTFALHLASALRVRSVALFGPTSAAEIYDYDGLILKLVSPLPCQSCYGQCSRSPDCMETIALPLIVQGVKRQLSQKPRC
ncbi:MAG: glycosyltransferase family 9 protein [Acidobacteriota bacterium]